MKVMIFGATGMLGSMVLDIVGREPSLEVQATTRAQVRGLMPGGAASLEMDAAAATVRELTKMLNGIDWVVNCIGVIKTRIHEGNAAEIETAIRVNALFPHLLAEAAGQAGCRVIQIATDCVYSGTKGRYLESDSHDPLDVYGKTKSLGEVMGPGFHNLRCSIVGPEQKDRTSLLEWFLSQPQGAKVTGYMNHHWNGITTLHFARICVGIVKNAIELPSLVHVVPADTLPKADLLKSFAKAFGRTDVEIEYRTVAQPVDRSLGTLDPAMNLRLWQAAGYGTPPSLNGMVEELARFIEVRRGNS